MSFFRNVLVHEVEAVFLNGNEFAEEVELDGVRCLAVIGEGASFNPGNYAPELPERTITLHVQTIDIADDLCMGGSVMLNGELHTVSLRKDDGRCGMTRLELRRNGY